MAFYDDSGLGLGGPRGTLFPFPVLGGRFWNLQLPRCPAAALPDHKLAEGATIAAYEVKIRLSDGTTFHFFAQNAQNVKSYPKIPLRATRAAAGSQGWTVALRCSSSGTMR